MKTPRLLTALMAALLMQATAAPTAMAQTPAAAASPAMASAGAYGGSTVRVDLSAGPAAQTLSLPRGKSAIIELPVDARDVLVTNPLVADAVLRTPRRIYVLGMAAGQTDASFFDGAGRRILSLNIRVDQDVSALSDTINRILPGSRVRVEPVADSVVLSGLVLNQGDADRAVQIAQRFVAKPENVLNMLSVAGKDQVMLKVRVIEVQRTVIKQLGVDLNALIGELGNTQFNLATAATFGINGSLLGGVAAGPSRTNPSNNPNDPVGTAQTADATIKAFERVGLVRTLAEPNLTTSNGEPANFLAGGEFPVPVGQDITGRVTIEFKKYGVGLAFTPVVLSGGRISLKVSVEVSELSNTGAFTLGTGNSTLVIPGLNVRRAENVVELPSGGSMMMAGLLQQRDAQNLDGIPGATSLPVIGSLFRSRDFLSGQTELVILVTPYIVEPGRPQDFQTPADGLNIANDTQTILFGKLNKTAQAPAGANTGRSYQGPVGYVIE